jgi:hydrogenase expression/formation protein HypE
LGIELSQRSIPIDEQVASACELLGLDPLYVANEGLFIAFVAEAQADAVLASLRQDENGMNACIIGEVVEEHPKQVIMESAIGGKRVISMLPGEQLPRIC